jgi:hypothetical protein
MTPRVSAGVRGATGRGSKTLAVAWRSTGSTTNQRGVGWYESTVVCGDPVGSDVTLCCRQVYLTPANQFVKALFQGVFHTSIPPEPGKARAQITDVLCNLCKGLAFQQKKKVEQNGK